MRPQARWLLYAQRIENELHRVGLGGFRQNYNLLKGFAEGGLPEVPEPKNPLKKAILGTMKQLPGISEILIENRRHLVALNRQLVELEIAHSRVVLDDLVKEFPNLQIPNGLGNGGSQRVFEWRSSLVSADWVPYLARAADLYRRIDPKQVSAILEIGPGLSFSTLAHLAINSHCKLVVNVDVPPILYIGTQFLKSIPDVDVDDYSTAGVGPIVPLAGKKMRVYMLAPWQLPHVDGQFDVMLNAASFQEMTPEICAAYAREVKRLAVRRVMLLCGDPRLKDKAKAAQWSGTTISPQDLVGLYEDHFPRVEVVDDGWCHSYESRGYRAVQLDSGVAVR